MAVLRGDSGAGAHDLLATVWLPVQRARHWPAADRIGPLRAELVALARKVERLPGSQRRQDALDSIDHGLACLDRYEAEALSPGGQSSGPVVDLHRRPPRA